MTVAPGPRGPSLLPRVLAIGLVVAAAIGAIFVLFVVLLLNSMRECNPPRSVVGEAPAVTVRLDAAHPVAEQRVVVSFNADALPKDLRAGAVTFSVVRPLALPRPSPSLATTRTSRPASPSGSATGVRTPGQPVPSVPDPDAAVRVTFLDGPTSRALATVQPDPIASGVGFRRDELAVLVLDCRAAEACSHDLRIVVSLVDPGSLVGATATTWAFRAEVDYGFHGCAGPPYTAAATIQPEPPVRLDAAETASTAAEDASLSGTLLARHVTVSTEAAPQSAWLHLAIRRSASTWVPWLVILPDDGGAAAFDGLLALPYRGDPEQTVDAPVFERCTPGRPCRAGYWIAIRGVPFSGGSNLSWAPGRDFGLVNASIEAVALARADSADAPLDVRLTLDGEPIELGDAPADLTGDIPMPLAADTSRAIEVRLHVPARPAVAAGDLDPLRAAYVVVRVRSTGSGVGGHLDGAGAGPLFAGPGGFDALIAHPFDDCPPVEACDRTIRLVGTYQSSSGYEPGSPQGDTWRVFALGAPVAVSASVGAAVDAPLPNPDSAGERQIPLFVVLIVGIVVVTLCAAIAIRSITRGWSKAGR